MSHLILTHQQTSDMNPIKAMSARSLGRPGLKISVGPVTAMVLMMTLIGLLGLISLTHLNAMSTKGYMMDKLEDEHGAFVSDGEINNKLILDARSLETIGSNPHVQAMVQPTDIYYVDSVTGIALSN
ncbi:MAG: hypothetical protein Q8P27_02255 [Candidatus Peregrinibacteria bacterium]|nr:hypothetical protein [Candidatus Peregrinibacteria bacterium]